MSDFLLAAAVFVLAVVVVGLVRVLRGPGRADRIMAVQLLGTGGVAVLLLLAQALPMAGVVDVALVLGLLAAFVAIAFVKAALQPAAAEPAPGNEK
jgi:multicomponent Na+:H+ antiporter subunit F